MGPNPFGGFPALPPSAAGKKARLARPPQLPTLSPKSGGLPELVRGGTKVLPTQLPFPIHFGQSTGDYNTAQPAGVIERWPHTLPTFPTPPPPPAHTQTGQVRHKATCFLKPEAITLERAPGGDMPLSGWGRVPQLLELSVLFFFFYNGSHT